MDLDSLRNTSLYTFGTSEMYYKVVCGTVGEVFCAGMWHRHSWGVFYVVLWYLFGTAGELFCVALWYLVLLVAIRCAAKWYFVGTAGSNMVASQ